MMKLSRNSIAILAALSLAGAIALPAAALATPITQVDAITATFVPTREEVQAELATFNRRLQAGREASFYSAKASSEYLEAQRYYQYGLYDEALAHARSGERALPSIPNWVNPATASR
jgi:1-aminocyclopropane-1-carboxylate deaminase/D-cysteine desulfhydrase-like pyridoxal-dependent ACC family enzyme